jgi:hypothetical protein
MQLPIFFTKFSLRLCINLWNSIDCICIAGTGYPWVERPWRGVDHFTFIKSSSSEAFSAPSWCVIGWTLPYFYLLTSISGCSRHICCWFWYSVGRICCLLRYSAIADTYVVSFDFRWLLISSYSRHTFMLLVAICIYLWHIPVVGCGFRLFQAHWWLWSSDVADTYMPVVGFAFELRQTHALFAELQSCYMTSYSLVELTTGLNILDLQFTEALIGLYFHTVNCTQLQTIFHRYGNGMCFVLYKLFLTINHFSQV